MANAVDQICPGDVVQLSYEDASYVYENFPEDKLPMRPAVHTFGRLLSADENFWRVAVAWNPETLAPYRTVAVPRRALIRAVILGRGVANLPSVAGRGRDFAGRTGDRVAVYWSDLAASDKSDVAPTPMLTEGLLVARRDGFILKWPQTLNLRRAVNHPADSPRYYRIPQSLIDEVVVLPHESHGPQT